MSAQRSARRRIGTPAEVAAVRFLQDNGFPKADRQPLRGNRDAGDIRISDLIIAEVKAGQYAERASVRQIAEWLAETDRERCNAEAQIGVLIVRRYRRPVALWDVWLTLVELYDLTDVDGGGKLRHEDVKVPVRLSLADFCALAERAAA